MNTLNVNESRLQEIAKSNITSYSLMLYFALRERHTESFNVRVMKNELLRSGIPVQDKDLYNVMEQLQSEGLGSVIYGKNGADDYFKWGYNINQFNRKGFDSTTLDPVLKLHPSERKEAFKEVVKGFIPVKRKPGRPKGSVNKMEASVKRSRGRPRGSKNKTKIFTIKLSDGNSIKVKVVGNVSITEITT